jgi:Rrf2 family protein
MKISTKGIYGLKAVIDLAVNSAKESITIKSIAERQGISESYLEQIFSILSKKGIIKSKKGAQGGYFLGDKGEDTTVGDVLRALEGDLSVISKDKKDEEAKMDVLLWHMVWEKMNISIDNVVDNITIGFLAKEYKKSNNEFSMYYI